MAGKIIIDTIDTDNAFITLNVQQSLIATMNVSGIYSNTGVKMIGANGTVSNTAITGLVTAAQIATVANTQITGNITSSQITSNPTFYGNVSVTGAIGVGGATPTSNGSGITFPATQSASSDANTLDDYEEGTWTATYGVGTTTGNYTKIGNTVALQVTLNVAGATFSSVTGLPFTGLGYAAASMSRGNGSSVDITTINLGSATTSLIFTTSAGAQSTITTSGTTRIDIQCTYQI